MAPDFVTATTAAPRRASVVEQELVSSLGWLISLRWVAGIAVLLGTLLVVPVFRVPLPGQALVWTGAAILLYNGVFRWMFYWIGRSDPVDRSVFESFARLQIALDWLATAVLIALSGGIESPVLVFFLFHITIASLLLPHRYGFLYVTFAPALVSVVALLEYVGWIPHVALVQPARYHDPAFVGVMLLFFTVTCFVMAYFCMAIARRLRRRERELGSLYDGVSDITSTLEIDTVLERIVEASARVLDCRAAAIRLIDPSRSQVEFAASWGLSEEYRGEVPAEYARSLLDQETLRDGVVDVRDVATDSRVWHKERVAAEGVASMLSVAIQGRKGPIGVLRAYGAPRHAFKEDDVSYLQAVAAQGAVAIEHAMAYQLLTQLDRDKSKFLRMTTHELRSPVRVIESLMTTLADGYVGPLESAQSDVVARAQKRLSALHALIDDLLDLAAGKADMVSVQRRVFALGDLVAEVVAQFQPIASEHGFAIFTTQPDEPLYVDCDPMDIARLVSNLVSNAVKYTKTGDVSISLNRDADRVVFAVADSGIGIPAAALPNLFQEFFRAPNAKAVEESGTGLGLSIVKLLVERYSGQISVASDEGVGTTFTVSLPGAEPPAVAVPIAS